MLLSVGCVRECGYSCRSPFYLGVKLCLTIFWDLVNQLSSQRFQGLRPTGPTLLTPDAPDSVLWGTHCWCFPGRTWLLFRTSVHKSQSHTWCQCPDTSHAISKAAYHSVGDDYWNTSTTEAVAAGMHGCIGWTNAWVAQLATTVMCKVSPPLHQPLGTGPRSL